MAITPTQGVPQSEEEYFAQIAQLEEKFAALEIKMTKKHEAQVLQLPYNEANPTEEEKAAVLKLDQEQSAEMLRLHHEKEAEIAKIRKPDKPFFMGETYSNPDLVGDY